jgi:hypothetical protein
VALSIDMAYRLAVYFWISLYHRYLLNEKATVGIAASDLFD